MKEHIFVSNYEWYLFRVIPLVGGNAATDRNAPFVLFRDDVQMDKLQRRLFREAQYQNREVENLVWENNDSVLFSIPFINVPVPIPYIITYREMQLSGELK